MSRFSNKARRYLFYRLPVIALCTAIFWQSSYPGIIKQPLFSNDDKVFHFIVYGILAVLTARCLAAEDKPFSPRKIRVIAILFAGLFGLSDEIHQAFVPARTASVGDFIADACGSILGTWVYLNIYLKKYAKHFQKGSGT